MLLGSRGTKVVYTGSQNYTEEGNRVNDEMVLRIWDRSTYNAYVRNLNYIRAHGTKGRITSVPRYIGNSAPVVAPDGEVEQVPGQQGGVEAGEERAETPMIDDDGFQRPVGGDVDFDG